MNECIMYAPCWCCCWSCWEKLIFKLQATRIYSAIRYPDTRLLPEQFFSAANVRELQFNFRFLLHPPQGAGHMSVCDFYTCPFWPGRRQRFMGERTKTFIENTFSILPLGDSRTSNCKFNKALYNMAKTLSPALTHTRCRCLGCECNNLQHFNRIRRRRWELEAGRQKAEDGQRPRSKMHFKCCMEGLWHLAVPPAAERQKEMAHLVAKETYLNMCQQICASTIADARTEWKTI